jgi:hypothetical protein
MTFAKLLTALIAAAGLLVLAMPTQVMADTMEQKQKLEQEFECTLNNSYGQSSTTTCKGKQTGEQTQGYYKDGKFIKVHKVANTGLDAYTASAVGGTVLTGIGAVVLKLKNQA